MMQLKLPVIAQVSDLMPRKLRISRYLTLKAMPCKRSTNSCGLISRNLEGARTRPDPVCARQHAGEVLMVMLFRRLAAQQAHAGRWSRPMVRRAEARSQQIPLVAWGKYLAISAMVA
jgi:hypothetical protein